MFFPSTFVCQGFSFNTSSTDNPVTKAFELDPPRVKCIICNSLTPDNFKVFLIHPKMAELHTAE